jgi:hypothetical protein
MCDVMARRQSSWSINNALVAIIYYYDTTAFLVHSFLPPGRPSFFPQLSPPPLFMSDAIMCTTPSMLNQPYIMCLLAVMIKSFITYNSSSFIVFSLPPH